MKRIYSMACATALAAYGASAQVPEAVRKAMAEDLTKSQLDAALTKLQVIGLQGGVMSNIKGAPYSGDQITENTQILGDGTRIHNENAVKVYRDSEGRVRRETPEMISIFDPVAGVGYTLNPSTLTGSKMQVSVSVKGGPNSVSYSASASSADGKTVQVYAGTKTATITGSGEGVGIGTGAGSGFFYSAAGPNIAFSKALAVGKAESLGPQTMEGVNVQGERRTHTIEAGEIGNDRPIQTIDEHWYSPDLQLDVMTRHSDPRTGEQTTRLVDIRRGDPDASLFQVPASYTINEGKNVPAVFKRDQ
ncbi:MAG: hypothetical protein WBY44_29680 [Bryobacteraceae bacterium]|jgi:hypothetical protein